MNFEYVKIGWAGDSQAFVCDDKMLGRVLYDTTNGHPLLATIEAREKLTKISSEHFTALKDIKPVFDLSQKPDEHGVYPLIAPTVKFSLEEVRYAVSCLIFENAERIGRKLRKRGHKPYDTLWSSCPPLSVDDAIHWMQETEKMLYIPRGKDGPELRGTPDDMHQLLTGVLNDNINYQVFASGGKKKRGDDFQMN